MITREEFADTLSNYGGICTASLKWELRDRLLAEFDRLKFQIKEMVKVNVGLADDRAELEQENERLKAEVKNWTDTARQYCRNSDYWNGRATKAEEALERICKAWENDKEGCSCVVSAEVTCYVGSRIEQPTAEERLREILDKHTSTEPCYRAYLTPNDKKALTEDILKEFQLREKR